MTSIKAGYFLRETLLYLGRNLGLAIATALTVTITLFLVGGSLLISQGSDRAALQFRGDVEFIVFMQPTATESEIAFVGRRLNEDPDVASVRYLNQDEAYDEFKELFANNPAFVEEVKPEILPSSYRVNPATDDVAIIEAIGSNYQEQPGVEDVVFAAEQIDQILRLTSRLRVMLFTLATGLTVAALILIFNTIRVAVFSRRQEIEIMKLVGASNWFIRVPFMLEGLVQALVGAFAGAAGLVIASKLLIKQFEAEGLRLLTDNFVVTDSEIYWTAGLLVVIAILVGTAAAALAVTIYLDA